MADMETIAVIDFETTGIGPNAGARATEIAAVLVCNGEITGRYQSLMNSGAWVPPFIEQLTGISNRRLSTAPSAAAVMREVMAFTRGCPLVAHNASFDRGFWLAEAQRAACDADAAHAFACTVLLSRRLYPDAPNCRLGTLAAHHRLPDEGRAHRALADALTTAHLLLRVQRDVALRFEDELDGHRVNHALLAAMQRSSKTALKRCVQDFVGRKTAVLA